MNLFVAVVVIASIPFVAVGLIRLAMRVLAFARRNRGQVVYPLATGILPEFLTRRLDDWLDGASGVSGGNDPSLTHESSFTEHTPVSHADATHHH